MSETKKINLSLTLMAWLFAFSGLVCELNAQVSGEIKGTPRIIHYNRSDFNGDPQIWAMAQDQKGIMYFGNNDGCLIFDGAKWHKIFLPNNSSVRSLLCSEDGVIYAGGYNELGQIIRDETGQYHYRSMMDLLPQTERNLENLWSIHEVKGQIVFRSFTKLVAISGNKALTIPTQSIYYSNTVNDQVFVVDGEGVKLFDIATLEFTPLVTAQQLNQEAVAFILEGTSQDEVLVFTKPGNAYTLTPDGQFRFFRRYIPTNSNNLLQSGIKSMGGNYFIGTLTTQLMVLGKSGELVQVDKAFLKLQDNTVLNLFESNEGNIWALLNNGIDCINISSPVGVMFENASVFDVLIHAGKIYAATNQGVYVSEKINQNPHFSSLAFSNVPGLEGQTWTLQNFQDKVICSHDRGVYIITGSNVSKIENLSGVWKVIPIRGMPNNYLACLYNGLALLEHVNGEFFVLNRIDGFNESSRDIIQDDEDGVFWVCHGYKGVFRIRIDRQFSKLLSLEHFRENGLPSPYSINVSRWNDQVVFTTNNGIFTFNSQSGNFEPFEPLDSVLGTEKNIRKILKFGQKTWFVQDDELGYFEQGKPELHKGLFLEIKGTFNRGMECVLPVNETNVLVGTNTGLFAYDLSFDAQQDSAFTLINQVSYSVNSDEVYSSLSKVGTFPFAASGIHFEFSSPKLKDQTRVQYSYYLEGLEENWSQWTEASEKEYVQLYPGRYTFHVKARSMLGEISPVATYSFVILPVWYLTNWAIAVYLIVLLGAIIGSRKLIRRKIQKEKNQTRVEEEKKQRVLELEIERMKLEREKQIISRDKEALEEDVIYKSKELANYTMLLVKKRELLTDLREELKELKELAKNEKSRNKLRELVRMIGIHLNDEEHIHVFEANFERVHHEFFTEMKAHFPDLTAKELRLCALVRMNLTNKEIAPILNISTRGVETARYRLRKRLSLSHDENTVEFLEKLSPASQVPPEGADDEGKTVVDFGNVDLDS